MSNWLAPMKRGLGVAGQLGLGRYDIREIITEGADIIMRERRTKLFPQFIQGVPQDVTVVNDEHVLEIFLASVIARSVRASEWQTVQFAYPAKKFHLIPNTKAWRALQQGLARHDVHPILLVDRDLYVFNDLDWHVAHLKIGIGLE